MPPPPPPPHVWSPPPVFVRVVCGGAPVCPWVSLQVGRREYDARVRAIAQAAEEETKKAVMQARTEAATAVQVRAVTVGLQERGYTARRNW